MQSFDNEYSVFAGIINIIVSFLSFWQISGELFGFYMAFYVKIA